MKAIASRQNALFKRVREALRKHDEEIVLEGRKQVDDALRNDVLARAGDPANRSQIIQPSFYETIAQTWAPPGAKAEAQAIAPDDPAAHLKQQRAELIKKIEFAKKQLKDKNCPDQAPPKEEKPAKPAEAAPKGGGGGGPRGQNQSQNYDDGGDYGEAPSGPPARGGNQRNSAPSAPPPPTQDEIPF